MPSMKKYGRDQRLAYVSASQTPYVTAETGPYTQASSYLERTWTRTVNYRALKESGSLLPENPFSRTGWMRSNNVVVTRPRYVNTFVLGKQTRVKVYDHAALRCLATPPTGSTISLISDNMLAAKLQKHLREAEWSAPVFFAEASQTIRMVSDTARTLASVMLDLRRGKFVSACERLGLTPRGRIHKRYNRTRAKSPSKAAADAWLQLQYGWVPLLHDVKSAAETLAEFLLEKENTRLTVRAKIDLSTQVSTTSKFSGTYVGAGAVSLMYKHSHGRRYTVIYEPTKLDSLGSFGLLNPLSVVWELVPLSFVADWFLPVGDYLNSLDTNLRFKFVSGLSSDKKFGEGVMVLKSADPGVYLSSGHAETFSYYSVSATRLTAIPAPSLLNASLPGKLGIKRLVSSLALLRQSFKF